MTSVAYERELERARQNKTSNASNGSNSLASNGSNRNTLGTSTPSAGSLALADGFYQVQDGKPYRIACKPGDVFHVDEHGVLQPGPRPRRTVAVRAE